MLQKKQLEYKLIKSKNSKKLRLTIKSNQQIVVTAPKYTSKKQIELFINENKNWIYNSLEKMNKNKITKLHSFDNNDSFLYLGEIYNLKLEYDELSKVVVDIINKELIVFCSSLNREDVKNLITNFYKAKSKEIIDRIFKSNLTLLENYQNINRIRIHKANTRWGSCSSKNNINFSSRISMLPFECIEYVFYHEITHLKEKNHSKTFYNSLSKICSNYKELEKDIRNIEMSHNLNID